MVFWKSLDMSKTKIMGPSADNVFMIMRREQIPYTGAYDTVKSTPSIMNDPSEHVLEYRSYWLSMSVVFTLKDIMGLGIFVFGVDKERKNCTLNVVDVAIS